MIQLEVFHVELITIFLHYNLFNTKDKSSVTVKNSIGVKLQDY